MSPAAFTEADWEAAVLASPVPVLVDFWAPWCIPCKKVEPLLAEVAERYGDRIAVGRVNADESPGLVARYAVLSLPTLLVMSGGEVGARVAGAPKAARLFGVLEPYLSER